ncbi:hypothetical protein DPMN_130517 [Dreissena polymorpha]|uniref:Uncharacterized protein n=1 Tax=Dreissena polymorpha TaxID=45954 RepID=A0A9D4H7R0_DREPO|nr:hypothetical protein DPMN_130517 [Dreissena polymorpha]
MTATMPLPPALQMASASSLSPVPPHLAQQFSGPKNLAGAATVKKRLFPIRPKPEILFTATPFKLAKESPEARTTLWYHRKQKENEAAGEYVKRNKQQRSNMTYTCSKCGELRLPPGHTQYFGSWFCMKMATQTFEEWRQEKEEEWRKHREDAK